MPSVHSHTWRHMHARICRLCSRPSRLKSLSLAGCDLEAEDHMALAAFLRFGLPDVPLETLDLSHVALVRGLGSRVGVLGI